MLLTSSQVSVAVSSVTVFVFTAALFLSGYAIQQRTLRDLRAAIKPSPRPSPKIFLPDRFKKPTTELEDGTIVELEPESAPAEYHGATSGSSSGQDEMVVEVRPTVGDDAAEMASADQPQQQQQQQENQQGPEVDSQEPTKTQTSKESPEERPQKPISRAERRRLIKEEIQKLSHSQERGYYQRRLW
ncbi:hypothetical protein QBC46DRAFT_378251 [Diplogelasinospora grovesii]|uniref:Uncharacterized protein n=1 Tax=Diplogelasinospora grovesii TaxID=303347 RepID=A0AAN6NE38_9PEZI|nr:hypothetical protein QBC46DRAFT_378251 [Diplogelasinospora grovesii]